MQFGVSLRGAAIAILRAVRLCLFVTSDALVGMLPFHNRGSSVVIRLDALGDFVLWLNSGAETVCGHLAEQCNGDLVLVANASWAAFARDLRIFKAVVAVDTVHFMRSPVYRLSILAVIRRHGASVIVQPRAAKVFLQEDQIVRWSGAARRIGSDSILKNISARLKRWSNHIYTDIVPVPLEDHVHESRRGRAFALHFTAPMKPLRINVAALAHVDRRHELPASYIVLAPGAGWSGRQWPLSNFVGVVTRVQRRFGLPCIVLGAGDDRRLGARLKSALPDVVTDLTGQSSIAETALIMAGAALVLANESGPLQLGIWAGAPSIGIVGGGHYGWFAPLPADVVTAAPAHFASHEMACFGCDWKCIYPLGEDGAVRCVTSVTVEQVSSMAAAQLEPHR